MTRWIVATAVALLMLCEMLFSVHTLFAADDTKVNAATSQVESGAKKIGQGKIGEGIGETAKGIGNTVVEGAKFTGEKFRESGQAAEPQAKSAWTNARDGAVAFGHSVRNFFQRLFTN